MESPVNKDRLLIEVAYKGTNYSGFQKQNNANTIQSEVEKALQTFYRTTISLTGSSRTDAGVHAKQNFFHTNHALQAFSFKDVYHINALLPADITLVSVKEINSNVHARFSASSRTYKYYLSHIKNPFTLQTSWYYPYTINVQMLNQAASLLINHTNYQAFSKVHTNVKTFQCQIIMAEWVQNQNELFFKIKANRFLRGMVRGLVGTMLLVGRNKISISQFNDILHSNNASKTNFSTPPHGLFLEEVTF